MFIILKFMLDLIMVDVVSSLVDGGAKFYHFIFVCILAVAGPAVNNY